MKHMTKRMITSCMVIHFFICYLVYGEHTEEHASTEDKSQVTCITNVYELLEPVDTVCSQATYEPICDGIIHVWTKCDFLRAIAMGDHNKASFAWLIAADVIYLANTLLQYKRYNSDIDADSMHRIYALIDHLSIAYWDAFDGEAYDSVICTSKILHLLKEEFTVGTTT